VLPKHAGRRRQRHLEFGQTQFTPVDPSQVTAPPCNCRDCWSKRQSDGRHSLVANFNSLGSTVTSIDNRLTTLENSGDIAPTAGLTVNSVTASGFLDTSEL